MGGRERNAEHQMYPMRMVSKALMLGLLVPLVVLALSTCGGGSEQQAQVRHLPEDEKPLPAGEYHTQEFKPSASFRLERGWISEGEAARQFAFSRDMGQMGFSRVAEVYKPSRLLTESVVEAPKDMVGWFQHHPYLKTTKPEPVRVGGVRGQQFDLVVVGDVPRVEVFKDELSGGAPHSFYPEEKVGIIVLEDVKGETVTIDFESLRPDFDEFAPKAEKVLDTVEWRGS